MSLLEIKGLKVAYGGIQAVRGIDLYIDEGELVCLIGANGAGKSSALKGLMGLIHHSGEVRFAGERLNGRPTYAIAGLGMALVPEGRGIFARLTVAENLDMGAYVRRDTGPVRLDLDRVYDLFPRLAERRTQLAGTLSGGEQQMLAMARAMMLNPDVVLLDEPSMGLAPILVQEVFRIIERLRAEGVTMLLVEQFAAAALKVADYGYVLENGRISVHGEAARLRDDPAVKAAYLGGGH